MSDQVIIPPQTIHLPKGATAITIPGQTIPVTSAGAATPPPPPPPPTSGVPKLDYRVYQNGAFDGPGSRLLDPTQPTGPRIPDDDSWGMSVTYASPVSPFPGSSQSVKTVLAIPNGGYQPLFVPNGSPTFFDTSPYQHLVFSARPAVDGARFWVGFSGNKDTADGLQIEVTSYGPPAQKGVWATWVIPLAAFGMPDRTALFKFSIVPGGGQPAGAETDFDNIGLTRA